MDILFASLVIFAASLTQGALGTGFVILGLPVLTLAFEPKLLVPVMTIHSMILGSMILIKSWKHAQWWRVWRLLLGGAVGVPIGVYLLVVLNPDTVRIVLGIAIIGFAALLQFSEGWKVQNERRALPPVGLVSGVMNGLVAMSGPPVVLFLTNQAVDKRSLRASITLFFFLQNIITLPEYFARGLLTAPALHMTLLLLPALLIGTISGILLHHRIPETTFRRALLAVMAVSGTSAIIAATHIIH